MTGWPLAIGIFVAGGCLSLYLALRVIRSVLADIDRRDGEGELLLTKDMITEAHCRTPPPADWAGAVRHFHRSNHDD